MDSACASNGKNKKGKIKLAHSQRQSASEREKMRMRTISKALQNLRRYLPPSVVPTDKNLTKIETLQLTIRYISHLSAQLGLSEEQFRGLTEAYIIISASPDALSSAADLKSGVRSSTISISSNKHIFGPV
ncbi:mesoderm posterior 1 [Pelobates cultripes]|uniref:Mesoderm posterior 1 n=1 Tax=Pelobates cultripes TaxID=61616 RepID=A0AAD1RN39_PELCU|nr:mesoderm posterior 1 [Pelobates cultripes]